MIARLLRRRPGMDQMIQSLFNQPGDEPFDQAECRAAVVEEIYRVLEIRHVKS